MPPFDAIPREYRAVPDIERAAPIAAIVAGPAIPKEETEGELEWRAFKARPLREQVIYVPYHACVLLCGLFCCLFVIGFPFYLEYSVPGPATSCPPCNGRDCKRALCPSVAPYVCTAGSAYNGCSSTPEAWIGNQNCNECCDLSVCSSMLVGNATRVLLTMMLQHDK
jgi:hypothetical protein